MVCVVIINNVESSLYSPDLFEDELDNVFTKRVDGIMHSEDFADLSNSTNDPVPFLIPSFIFNEVVPHVDQRHPKDIIVARRLEGGIIFTFTDTLCKIRIVLQREHQFVNFGTH